MFGLIFLTHEFGFAHTTCNQIDVNNPSRTKIEGSAFSCSDVIFERATTNGSTEKWLPANRIVKPPGEGDCSRDINSIIVLQIVAIFAIRTRTETGGKETVAAWYLFKRKFGFVNSQSIPILDHFDGIQIRRYTRLKTRATKNFLDEVLSYHRQSNLASLVFTGSSVSARYLSVVVGLSSLAVHSKTSNMNYGPIQPDSHVERSGSIW
ncbi:hypothetical protein ABKN59_011029 [Abortiporus biennis]